MTMRIQLVWGRKVYRFFVPILAQNEGPFLSLVAEAGPPLSSCRRVGGQYFVGEL
jgi:hypothetical protein